MSQINIGTSVINYPDDDVEFVHVPLGDYGVELPCIAFEIAVVLAGQSHPERAYPDPELDRESYLIDVGYMAYWLGVTASQWAPLGTDAWMNAARRLSMQGSMPDNVVLIVGGKREETS